MELLSGLLVSAIMGSYYANAVVSCDDHEAVVQHVGDMQVDAVVSPPIDGHILVAFDVMLFGDPQVFISAAAHMSGLPGCTALAAMNADDDLLLLAGGAGGEPVFFYSSSAEYLAMMPENYTSIEPSYDGSELASLFGKEDSLQKLNKVLTNEGEAAGYVLETDRHREIAKLLDMPAEAVVNWGMSYIPDEIPDDIDRSGIVRFTGWPTVEPEQ